VNGTRPYTHDGPPAAAAFPRASRAHPPA
jgi:hypothetical protein